MQRYGMTIPFGGVPLHEHREWIQELVELGYTDVWSAEADGGDGFTPLALTSVWAPSLRLGTAIIPAYTRGPALLAQTVGSIAQAAPGRFALGIGSSSNVIVEGWNGIPFEEPYKQVQAMVRFLRDAMEGEKVTKDYGRFSVRSFRLGMKPPEPVPILIAALREGMLRLAGREGDGAILNWLSPDDVTTVVPHVAAGAEAAGHDPATKEIAARLFVIPNPDAEVARGAARRIIAAYLNVPVYAAFHEWLGRGDDLKGMWDLWKEGDRAAALEAIPDHVVDDLVVHGAPEVCREQIGRYIDNGITTPALAVLPFGVDMRESIRALSPSAAG
ncbi:MAG: LLM class F420-dependent oxidoreductase [Acidimicrobiales bacterium]|nr:LLM class F420-dependent oxidoreductase [Acidimicrobiales bacterium]